MRARVEYPFRIVKNIFDMKKVRYRGLAKNTAQLYTLFGLANLLIAKRRLFAPSAQVRPEMGEMMKIAREQAKYRLSKRVKPPLIAAS